MQLYKHTSNVTELFVIYVLDVTCIMKLVNWFMIYTRPAPKHSVK